VRHVNVSEEETGRLSRNNAVAMLERHLAAAIINEQSDQRPGFYTHSVLSVLNMAIESKWRLLRQVQHPEPAVSFSYDEWKLGEQRAHC
jgi:hypothetical protein